MRRTAVSPSQQVYLAIPTHPELRAVGIIRYRHVDLDVVGRTSPLELSLDLDHVLHSTSTVTLYTRLDPNQRLDRRGQSVGHELEFAVGWDKRDGAVVLETCQSDTLVELDVFHFDGLASRSCVTKQKAMNAVLQQCEGIV